MPPANGRFPASRSDAYADVFPRQYVIAVTEKILTAIGLDTRVSRMGETQYQVSVRTAEIPLVVRKAEAFVLTLPLLHPDVTDFWPNVSMALDWQTIPGDAGQRGYIGNLEYLAKWKGNQDAAAKLGSYMADLADRHSELSRAQAVVAVGSSRDLSQFLAGQVARALRVHMYIAKKSPAAGKQQDNIQSFDDALAQYSGSILVPRLPQRERRVLIVDDLYGKGTTIAEVTRCLRAQGIEHVSGWT